MNLHDIEIAGPKPAQALLDPRRHVLAGVDVFLPAVPHGFDPDLAGAFRCKHDVGATVLQRFANQLLAQSIIDGGVDVVDAEVEDAVDESDRIALADRTRFRRAGKFHRPIAKPTDEETGVSHLPCAAGQLGLSWTVHAFSRYLALWIILARSTVGPSYKCGSLTVQSDLVDA